MNIIKVLNARIKERGITISELSRRVGMNSEMLRRSLAGWTGFEPATPLPPVKF